MIRFFIICYFLMTLNISAAEYLKFNSPDKRFPNNPEVLVEISLPKDIEGKLPVIITQHGSTRDGKKIKDGAIDEYSKRVIEEGIKQGFAVAAIDAFYNKQIKATNKTVFPNATEYANSLRKILVQDIFYNVGEFLAPKIGQLKYKQYFLQNLMIFPQIL